jgi:hypothetical protein
MSLTVASRRSLLPWLLAGTIAAGAVLTLQLVHAQSSVLRLPLFDYVAFWAAGRLNAAGADPYDPALLAALEREANPNTVDVLVMWPAPWALSLLAPFTRLGPQTSHLLWQFTQLAVLLGALELLWRCYGGDPARRWVAWLIAFTFPPSYFLLVTGQFGAVLLLGLAGFLYFQRQGRQFAAGACLSLAAIKPQLTFLFWIALLLWTIEGSRWRLALGGVVAVVALLVVPVLQNPHLPADYWVALTQRTQTHSHQSPVAGTALRLLLAPSHFWPQFVPLVPGMVWVAWYWQRHHRSWNWNDQLPAVLFVSFLSAPYGAWPFDLVVLLVPVIARVRELECATRPRQVAIAACFLSIGAVAVAEILCEVEYFWFLWMTPALLALTFAARAGFGSRRQTMDAECCNEPRPLARQVC